MIGHRMSLLLRMIRVAVCVTLSGSSLPAASASLATQRAATNIPDQAGPAGRELLSEEMLRLADVGEKDVVYDFGSLDSVPVTAALKFGARAYGVGLEASQVEAARNVARAHGVASRARFIEGHLLTADFSEATVVTVDLTSDLNLILGQVLWRQLRPGTRIVSHRFGLGALRADETARASDGSTLFLWIVPRQPSRTPDIFFVPTTQPVVEQMLELGKVTASDVLYDLGSGDGRIVIVAAVKYAARAVGVELDPKLIEISNQVARQAEVANQVRFVEGDLFNVDLSEATVVTLFLSRGINQRLEAKLKRELRDGARVVSHQFDMGAWVPDQIVAAEDGTSLYLWTIRKQ
jgi:Methyltransferase domain